jgi:hypothetical protein
MASHNSTVAFPQDIQYHDMKALTKTKIKTMLVEESNMIYDMRYNSKPKKIKDPMTQT